MLLTAWTLNIHIINISVVCDFNELHPLWSLVTSVLGHFSPFQKDRIDPGPKWLSHFGPKDQSVHQRTGLHITRTDEMSV